MATRMFRGRVAAALTVAVIVGMGGIAQATAGAAEDAVVPPATNPVEEPASGGEILSEDSADVPEPDSSVPTEGQGEQSDAPPALVSPFSAPGVGGPSPFVVGDKTISNIELCSSSYLQDGVLTIDLSQDAPVPSGATLTIGDPDNNDAVSCINDVTSIEIVNTGADGYKHLNIAQRTFSQDASSGDNTLKTVTFPAGLETLTIGDDAFYQYTFGGGSNALTSVNFPDGLEALAIGDYAFTQYAFGGGSNALTSVAFPDDLEALAIGNQAFHQRTEAGANTLQTLVFPTNVETLTIGDYAFYQQAYGGGDNALESVEFPESVGTLRIYSYAFRQHASGGGSNALTRVAFPGGPEELTIGDYAFDQTADAEGSNTLESVEFPANTETLTIGNHAFSQSADGSNTLESVDFPDDLKKLDIGEHAFDQYAGKGGSNALETVVFPANTETLTIEGYAFYQEADDGGNNALTLVTFPESPETLIIGEYTFSQYTYGGGNNALASISFSENLEMLTIGGAAFHQEANGGGSNALTSVDFPDSLETLTIGGAAFHQYASGGDGNALTSVNFPDSLETLTIGGAAFAQQAFGGSNALKTVTFPAGLETLAIGVEAFSQYAYIGGSNALTSVVFPVGLGTLDVGDRAFFLAQDSAGLVLFFPFTEDGVPVQVSLGENVTNSSDELGASLWVWLGPDGADTVDAWGAANQYALRGALSATFEPGGGTLVGANQLFIFPAVDGVPQVASLDQVADLDPAGFHSGDPSYLLDLPVAEPAPSWGGTATFGSWCAGEWADGACEVSPSPLGVAVELEAGLSPHLFRATWQVTPPSPVLVPSAGCGLAPTVSIPDSVEGLFTYTRAEESGQIVVSAEPGAPYVLLTDGVWPFDVSLPTYTVSFALDGGTGSFPNINVEGDGCMITLPTQIPARDGHTFKGWLPTLSGQTTGTVLAPGAQFQVTQNTTMSAQWEAVVNPPKPVVPPINPEDPDNTNPDPDNSEAVQVLFRGLC